MPGDHRREGKDRSSGEDRQGPVDRLHRAHQIAHLLRFILMQRKPCQFAVKRGAQSHIEQRADALQRNIYSHDSPGLYSEKLDIERYQKHRHESRPAITYEIGDNVLSYYAYAHR